MWVHLLLLSSLMGTVLDEKNRPIEGAVVVLVPSSFREDPATATSDAAGRFEIAVSKPGPFRVEAYASGYAPFRLRDVAPEKPLSIVLRRGGEFIAGIVRDGATLDPVKGATVETRAGESSARVSAEPRLGLVDTVSDERGEFRLEGLAKSSYSVSASAPGYGRTTTANVSPGAPVELYLFPGSGVYGRLLGEEGNPVEGAFVSAESEEGMHRMRRGPSTAQQSDADGRFAFLGLEPGRYRLFARHADFAPAAHDLELSKENDAEVELVLTAGVTLTGRLVDENEDPVAGKVSLRALDGGSVGALLRSRFTAETDAKGVFSLPSVPPGEHMLVAEARGYGATNAEAPASGRNKEEDLGDIVLETGLSISGKVLGESGSPVAGAMVHAFPSLRAGIIAARPQTFEAETDGEGRFVLAGLSEGIHNLLASAPGFGSSKLMVAEPGALSVTITLKPAGSIRGTVVDPEGRSVTSFRAMARSADERGFGGQGVADEEGIFVLETVAEGEYAVEIVSPDFMSEVVSSVRVTAGNVTELGTIRLRRGGRIGGTVVNGSEEPVPGATVRAVPAGWQPYDFGDNAVSTDRLGRFQIAGLLDGKVDVAASHPSYAGARQEAIEVDSAAGASEVRIVLRRGGAVEGYVRSRDGTETAGRTIRAASDEPGLAPWDASSARTSEDGYFHIEHLPPGKITVALVQVEPTTMYAIQSREVDVAEGETTYVEFHSRRVLVQGQARRGGSPLSGAAIALSPLSSGSRMSVRFGSQGRPPSLPGPRYLAAIAGEDGYYELLVDEPGEYRLSASANGVGLPSRTVTIPDAESLSLDLDFGGALVSGRVVDKETEAPVAGAFVTARPVIPSTSGSGTGLQAGPDGLFEIELDPGEFTIAASADGYATAEEKIAVEEGGRSDLVFALSTGLRITGRVVDANGRGLGNLGVMAVEDSPDLAAVSMRMGFAMTIPDGSFSLGELARGRYNILVAGDLAGFAFLPSVPSGTEDLELPLRAGGKVEVSVVDAEGARVANAIVAVAGIDGRKVRGVQGAADGSGRLELKAPRGNLTIKAAVLNGPEGMSTVAVSENATARVEIVLARAASTSSKK
jgi:protocatechuate 3,4-dioxygenase beta subunit